MSLLDNFWVLLVLKVLIIALVVPGVSLVIIFAELKVSAHMQNRIGPYFAGGRWGWAQPLADGLKFMQKEDLIPADADRAVFKAAPMVMLMGTIATFVVIPFSPKLIVADLDIGVFYLLAIGSISSIAVLIAGWASANKYSLMGGLRAAAQLVAYELPLVLAVVGVVIQAGTMSMNGIVAAQAEPVFLIGDFAIRLPFLLQGQVIGFTIFVIAMLAELSRTPFDLPIAESELVMGYLTEYSGLRFTMFFLGEYAGMFSMSAIAATLYLGGWYLPGLSIGALEFLGPLILMAKVGFLVFLVIWFRWTFPRLRQDQLQSFAWRWLVPLGLANILGTGIAKVVF
ncbi:MAG: NADH-quinone oxidoreductase subunit NuoH [Acidimicrobiia bacterium]|nr:MAG: NADH-quinone oxidoreductase subunit NuoH [Acidimicrobiia bacterium]